MSSAVDYCRVYKALDVDISLYGVQEIVFNAGCYIRNRVLVDVINIMEVDGLANNLKVANIADVYSERIKIIDSFFLAFLEMFLGVIVIGSVNGRNRLEIEVSNKVFDFGNEVAVLSFRDYINEDVFFWPGHSNVLGIEFLFSVEGEKWA